MSELRIPNSESRTPNPELRIPNSESRTPNPELRIPNSESRTPNPELRIPNSESRTPNPELRIPNSESRTPNPELPTTSVLFIDGSKDQRAYWAEQLKRCSLDYEIVEASDGQSGLDIHRSRRIDCVVLELSLPDQSGWQTLIKLVPIASRPHGAVVVLTHMTHRGVWELTKENGAYACLAKKFSTGADLDKAIQRAVAFVGQMPKEDRNRVPIVNYGTSRTAE